MFSYNRYKKFILIFIGLIAGPAVVFFMPYLLDIGSYSKFAKILSISQLIALIGGLGLETSGPKYGFKQSHIFIFSAFILIFIAIILKYPMNLNFDLGISAIFIAISIVWFSIFQSYLIFSGLSEAYGGISVIKSISNLAIFYASFKLGIKIEYAWAIAGIFSTCGVIIFFNIKIDVLRGKNLSKITSISDAVYKALPLFIMNNSTSTPNILDRAVAQSLLPGNKFAEYAIVTTWCIPIIYLGNAFQQYLISNNKIERKSIKKLSLILLIAILIYIIVIGIAIANFKLIPNGYDIEEVFVIFISTGIAYGLFSAFIFPNTAYFFKYANNDEVIKLSKLLVIFGVIGVMLSYLFLVYSIPKIGLFSMPIFSGILGLFIVVPRYLIFREIKES